MKVTIDTKHDSHEDIQKVLTILTNILDKKNSNAENANEPAGANDTTSMMKMFTDNSNRDIPETSPDFPQLMKLTKEANRKSSAEQPKIEFF